MTQEQFKKWERRARRKKRVRKKVFGTPDRPRLAVHKSLKHTYAQVIDDTKGHTIVFASTLSNDLDLNGTKTWTVEAARKVGLLIGKKASEKGIKKVVFDRGGFKYHGRIKAVAEGAREAGLEF